MSLSLDPLTCIDSVSSFLSSETLSVIVLAFRLLLVFVSNSNALSPSVLILLVLTLDSNIHFFVSQVFPRICLDIPAQY